MGRDETQYGRALRDAVCVGNESKMGHRTYIELYAGSGYNRIEGSDRLIAGSLRVLQLKDRFATISFAKRLPHSWRRWSYVWRATPPGQRFLILLATAIRWFKEFVRRFRQRQVGIAFFHFALLILSILE